MLRYLSIFLLLVLFGCNYPTRLLGLIPAKTTAPDAKEQNVDIKITQPLPSVAVQKKEPLIPNLVLSIPESHNNSLWESSPLPYVGDFPLSEHARVAKLIKSYSGPNKKMFGHWLERSARYIPQIQMVFASEGIPLDLAYLAMIESGFNVRAYSWAHAAGPWQFIEGTGKVYGLKNNWWQDERLDLEKSTRAAAKHLKYLHDRFDGNWYLAVAAYNAGGGKISKAVRERGSQDFWDLIKGKVLREETRNYLPKLLAALNIVKNLKAYGFADLNFERPVEYEVVTLETSTDLETIAGFCGISYQELKELNPELKRWCTPPGVTGYRLRVPFGSATQVNALYAQLPRDQRAHYHRQQIKSGDTLQVLARKYRIQVDDIIALNNIKNPRALKIGSNLILPLKEGYTRLPMKELADSYVRSRRQVYNVRRGDSLWSISRRFNVTQKELRVWNKLGWSNFLHPGQTLAVSKPGVRHLANAQPKKRPAQKMIYKVLPGDTLWGISRQFDVETEQIRRWNELPHGHILQPGQKLTLMVSVSQQG